MTQWCGWLIIIGTNENFCPSFLGNAQNWRFGFCFGAAIQCNLQLVEPWPPAMKVLAEYPGEKGICIGGSFETVIELSNETKIEKSYEQKVFILVPSAFSSPKLIIVVKDQDGKISKTESHFGFWFVFLVYSACLWFVWRFGIRPQIKRSK